MILSAFSMRLFFGVCVVFLLGKESKRGMQGKICGKYERTHKEEIK